jgi:RNA polymerase sigma-70 factor (ECF subfamily)
MNDDRGADVFEGERARLVGLAYRLLGSVSDAEDVVQEAWFRWSSADQPAIDRPTAWLTTVVSRLGLDRLRAQRRARVVTGGTGAALAGDATAAGLDGSWGERGWCGQAGAASAGGCGGGGCGIDGGGC